MKPNENCSLFSFEWSAFQGDSSLYFVLYQNIRIITKHNENFVDFWSCLGQQTKRYTKTTSACFTKPNETGALWSVQRSTFRRAKMCVYVRCAWSDYWGKVDWNNNNPIDYTSTTHAHNHTPSHRHSHTRTHQMERKQPFERYTYTTEQKDDQRASKRARGRDARTQAKRQIAERYFEFCGNTLCSHSRECVRQHAGCNGSSSRRRFDLLSCDPKTNHNPPSLAHLQLALMHYCGL